MSDDRHEFDDDIYNSAMDPPPVAVDPSERIVTDLEFEQECLALLPPPRRGERRGKPVTSISPKYGKLWRVDRYTGNPPVRAGRIIMFYTCGGRLIVMDVGAAPQEPPLN